MHNIHYIDDYERIFIETLPSAGQSIAADGMPLHQLKGAMSSSQLELIRLNHELCEKYELAVGDELDLKPNGVRGFRCISSLSSSNDGNVFLTAKSQSLAAA